MIQNFLSSFFQKNGYCFMKPQQSILDIFIIMNHNMIKFDMNGKIQTAILLKLPFYPYLKKRNLNYKNDVILNLTQLMQKISRKLILIK